MNNYQSGYNQPNYQTTGSYGQQQTTTPQTFGQPMFGQQGYGYQGYHQPNMNVQPFGQPTNQQVMQSLQQMRSIIQQLRQQESQNAQTCNQISSNISNLQPGGLESFGSHGQQGQQYANQQFTNQLRNIANAEQNAVQQLDHLSQMVSQLENMFRH